MNATWPSGAARAAVGGSVWIVALAAVRPHPFDLEWGRAVLVLAALVLLPIGTDLTAPAQPDRRWSLAERLQLPAALLLGTAYLCPQGLLAAGLALPWLAVTGLMAAAGVARVRRRGRTPLPDLCIDAASVFVVVGGAWAVTERVGYRPLNFEPAIVLLTAIHFHYAGFALPLVTGLAARAVPGAAARTACVGVLAGVPLVAVGITATQLGAAPLLECAVAWVMAGAGLSTAWLLLRLALRPAAPRGVRVLWAVAAVSLVWSMALAGLYGTRFFVPVAWLDIPWMRALHGTANALGFGLCGLLAWRLAPVTAPTC